MVQQKIVVIHQPDFAPHLAFFHRLFLAHLFIVFDDVQFLRRGWHHRDKIKTKQGARWLTVPVQKDKLDQKINKMDISGNREAWIRGHLDQLTAHYRTARYFDVIFPQIRELYHFNHSRLIDFNMTFLRFFFDLFSIKIEMAFSSQFAADGKKNDKLTRLVTAAQGTHYLTGSGSAAYLDRMLFSKSHIAVLWQQFTHPVYPQLHGEFIPYLSCIDFAMNCGGHLKKYLEEFGNTTSYRDGDCLTPSEL